MHVSWRTLLLVASIAACRQATPKVEARVAPLASDSLRGVLSVTGSEPMVRLVLRHEGGVCEVREAIPSGLSAAQGLEITVWGVRDDRSGALTPAGPGCGIAVSHFAVRSADGLAATDGTLCSAAAGYELRLTGGARRPLVGVPPALQSQRGARIYWVGPLDRAPSAYGVLEENIQRALERMCEA